MQRSIIPGEAYLTSASIDTPHTIISISSDQRKNYDTGSKDREADWTDQMKVGDHLSRDGPIRGMIGAFD